MKTARFIRVILAFFFVFAVSVSPTAFANMAAPAEPDVASAITFEKNDRIAVLSEELDIVVNGSKAEIAATYKMKNTADTSVSTESMFLSPNVEKGRVQVVVDGRVAPFTTQSYALNYSTKVKKEDWRYAVLTRDSETDHDQGKTVDAITFRMEFAPGEEYEVKVSYTYRLGGYPELDFDAKMGTIEYYLTPAAMWKDFSDLTIRLSLDEEMPVIKSSTLDFQKIAPRTYQYRSDTLPEEDLEIVIDENWWQTIVSTFKSPYLPFNLLMFLPCILCVVVVAIVLLLFLRNVRKKSGKKESSGRP